jgi:4-amino-4-deoxy-L-arabinose transferase-like glycosyltransferase
MITLSFKNIKLIFCIAVVGLAIRIAAGLFMGWNHLMHIADQPVYDAFGKNIIEGKGFQLPDLPRKDPKGNLVDVDLSNTGFFGVVLPNQPTAFFEPVYPVMIAVAYGIFGEHPGAARLFQSLFDAIGCFLIGWMGVRLFGIWQGILASLMYALYPAFIGLTTVLWTIGMGVFTMVLALALTVYFQQKPTGWSALGMGLAWGLAVLTRTALLPFFVVVLILCWWDLHKLQNVPKPTKLRAIWKYPALMIVGILILLLPWGIRNAVVMGHFTVMPTKGGRNLWEANNCIFSEPYWKYSATADGMARIYHKYAASRRDKIQRTDLIEYPNFSIETDEFERDQQLTRQVKDFLLANPKVAIELCFLRLYSLFRIQSTGFSKGILSWIGLFSMGFVLFMGLLGLIINARQGSRYKIFYLLILYYIAVHTVTAAGIPHRLPLDAVLILFAASAIYWIYEQLFLHVKME